MQILMVFLKAKAHSKSTINNRSKIYLDSAITGTEGRHRHHYDFFIDVFEQI